MSTTEDAEKVEEVSEGRVHSAATTGLFVLAIFFVIYVARPILMPLALAGLLSLLLYPIVEGLHRHVRLPRALSAAALIGGLLVVVAFGLMRLSAPAGEWMERLPEASREVERKVRRIKEPIERVREATEQIQSMTASEEDVDTPPTVRVQTVSYVGVLLNQTWAIVAGGALTVALLYFLLASGDLFFRKLVRVLPTFDHRREAGETVLQIRHDVSVYILSITAINAGLGVATGLAMYFMGLPNAVLWGVMAMLFNYIPYAGAVIGTLVVGLVALLTHDEAYWAFGVMGVYYGLTVIEGTFITPLILGRRLMLNAVVVFVSLLLWGWMWGIPGALLAVPLVAAFKIVCDHVPKLEPIGELLGR